MAGVDVISDNFENITQLSIVCMLCVFVCVCVHLCVVRLCVCVQDERGTREQSPSMDIDVQEEEAEGEWVSLWLCLHSVNCCIARSVVCQIMPVGKHEA